MRLALLLNDKGKVLKIEKKETLVLTFWGINTVFMHDIFLFVNTVEFI